MLEEKNMNILHKHFRIYGKVYVMIKLVVALLTLHALTLNLLIT